MWFHSTSVGHIGNRGNTGNGNTQGMGPGFFHHSLFQLILLAPSHGFKALGDGVSTK